MAYAHTTLAQARTALAARLNDPGFTFWSAAELDRYIVEALRTFQALTGFYRDRLYFQMSPNVPFYDLNLLLADYNLSVTDLDAWNLVLPQLVEPTTVPYAGTDHFTQDQIVSAMQRRRNQFLVDTGCKITRSSIPVPMGTYRLELDESVVDVRRLAWIDGDNVVHEMYRDDEHGMMMYRPLWESDAPIPDSYSVMLTRPVTIQLINPTSSAGTLDALTINAPANIALDGSSLGIPNDFMWAIRFGALSDLLAADGPAQDKPRAEYCEARYKEGVQLATVNPSVLNVLREIPPA